jgi:hypothetical protein
MGFLGEVDFKDGRSPSQTTTLILQRCLGCARQDPGNELEGFFKSLAITQKAFAKDIDADWDLQPFVGQHAFKIAQAAGYEGSENDFWLSTTGRDAPYPIKKIKLPPPPKKPRLKKLKKTA